MYKVSINVNETNVKVARLSHHDMKFKKIINVETIKHTLVDKIRHK